MRNLADASVDFTFVLDQALIMPIGSSVIWKWAVVGCLLLAAGGIIYLKAFRVTFLTIHHQARFSNI